MKKFFQTCGIVLFANKPAWNAQKGQSWSLCDGSEDTTNLDPLQKYKFWSCAEFICKLQGLSSEMEGGMTVISINRSPFKQWTAERKFFNILLMGHLHLKISTSKQQFPFQVLSFFSLHTWKTKIICYIHFNKKKLSFDAVPLSKSPFKWWMQ